MTTTIRLRRGTATQWTTSNPVLALGEMGLETDTTKIKFGDGTTAWSVLPYANSGGGGGTGLPTGGTTGQALTKNSNTSGDAGWSTLTKATVGLGSVDNTADSAKNVASATRLTTARTINGVSFDGTANIQSRLDQAAAPTGDVSMGGHKITNLLTPATGTDAATMAYVDAADALLLPQDNVKGEVEANFPQLVVMIVYNAGWTIPGTLATDPLVAFHFVGGSDATPPPSTTGPAVWDRTP